MPHCVPHYSDMHAIHRGTMWGAWSLPLTPSKALAASQRCWLYVAASASCCYRLGSWDWPSACPLHSEERNSSFPLARDAQSPTSHTLVTMHAENLRCINQAWELRAQQGTPFFFFFFFFWWERYSLHEETITTSKKRDVHCIPWSWS